MDMTFSLPGGQRVEGQAGSFTIITDQPHAFADAKLVEPPAEVTLDFSEEIEPMFSAIEVEDAKGGRVDKGDVHTAPDNAKRLVVSIDARE